MKNILLVIVGLTVLGICFARAQTAPVPLTIGLELKSGKATAARYFSPRSHEATHIYRIGLDEGQIIAIKLISKSVFLSKENECGLYFTLKDSAGKSVFLGDSPTGIDDWQGKIKTTGRYTIGVRLSCLEAFTDDDLRRVKPRLHYSVKIEAKNDGDKEQ